MNVACSAQQFSAHECIVRQPKLDLTIMRDSHSPSIASGSQGIKCDYIDASNIGDPNYCGIKRVLKVREVPSPG